jgi:peptide/nickel transport system substrate-binding protein
VIRRIVASLAVTVIAAGAFGCENPSPSVPVSQSPSVSPGPSSSLPTGGPTPTTISPTSPSEPAESPTQPPASVEDQLFGSDYPDKVQAGAAGGSVTIGDWRVPTQLNPYYGNGPENWRVLASTMRGLWTISYDAKWYPELGVHVPRLSNGSIRMDTTGGGFTVHVDIRPGLHWSDGQPLDLNDLRYTWQWITDPEQIDVPGFEDWQLIDRFDVSADGLTADVHFKQGFADWMALLSGSPLPEHYMKAIPVADALARSYPVDASIVGAPVSGPFKYSSVSADTIELVRNDYWLGNDSAAPHPPYLDGVTYRFYPGDKRAMIDAFVGGDIDVAADLLGQDLPALAGVDPNVGRPIVGPSWEYEHFDFNRLGAGGLGSQAGQPELTRGNPALTDVRVRTALAEAIDKDALWQALFPGLPLADDQPCTPVPPPLFWRTTDGLNCAQYNPDDARRLLDETGYVDPGTGIRAKDGSPLELQYCSSGTDVRTASADFLTTAFRRVGVQLDAVRAPATMFNRWNDPGPDEQCQLADGNYDTAEFAWIETFYLFGNYYYKFHSSQVPSADVAGSNYTRLSDPRMDAAIDELRTTVDPARQVELARQIQRLHSELQPEVVLFYRTNVRAVSTRLMNFFANPATSTDMWNVEDWYLTP